MVGTGSVLPDITRLLWCFRLFNEQKTAVWLQQSVLSRPQRMTLVDQDTEGQLFA